MPLRKSLERERGERGERAHANLEAGSRRAQGELAPTSSHLNRPTERTLRSSEQARKRHREATTSARATRTRGSSQERASRYSEAKPPRRNLPRRASSSAVAEVGQTGERKSTCTPARSTSNQRLSGRRSGKGSACPVRTRRRAEAARSRDFEPGQDAIAFWSIPTTSRLATWCESCVSREGNSLRRRRG